jgi:hypothetical protein
VAFSIISFVLSLIHYFSDQTVVNRTAGGIVTLWMHCGTLTSSLLQKGQDGNKAILASESALEFSCPNLQEPARGCAAKWIKIFLDFGCSMSII